MDQMPGPMSGSEEILDTKQVAFAVSRFVLTSTLAGRQVRVIMEGDTAQWRGAPQLKSMIAHSISMPCFRVPPQEHNSP